MHWKTDDRVRHPAMPDWGLGRVLRVSTGQKLLIEFTEAGKKLLKGAPLTRVTGAEAEWPTTRRKKVSPRQAKRSIEQYREAFLDQFPKGFEDPAYLTREREHRLEASHSFTEALGKKPFERLLTAGGPDAVCKIALAAAHATNLIFPSEKMALRDGLVTPKAKRRFSSALFDLLHGPAAYEDRFERFTSVLDTAGASRWTIATYFPFLAAPDVHIFVKPEATKHLADACGVPLNYRPEPNWLTYRSAQTLAGRMNELLADLQPRDMIDIQSFIWCVGR